MDNELKEKIMKEIEDKSTVFRKKSNIQYLIRCPICGDTDKDPNHAHCYIKKPIDPKEPLQYNCFLCNSNGKINKYFLSRLGIDKKVLNEIKDDLYNQISSYKESKELNLTDINIDSDQIKYIEYRIGKGFNIDDYQKFRIVQNINDVILLISSKKILNTLPSNQNSISFLSDDNSVLLTRLFEDEDNKRWFKKRLFHSDNKLMYTIKTSVNLFTEEEININISEGVMDALSSYKNFSQGISINLAVLGSNYIEGIEYMISKGFIGSNINIKIYIDDNINIKELKNQLKKYKWLFKNINIYENILYKDIGTTLDKIQLKEYKI